MIRSLLLVLFCLLAAMPSRVCTCGHHHHAAPADREHDDGGEPCHCSCDAPRDACQPPRSLEPPTHAPGLPVADAATEPFAPRPPVVALQRCGEPPGRGFPSVPLFLAVSRLLI